MNRRGKKICQKSTTLSSLCRFVHTFPAILRFSHQKNGGKLLVGNLKYFIYFFSLLPPFLSFHFLVFFPFPFLSLSLSFPFPFPFLSLSFPFLSFHFLSFFYFLNLGRTKVLMYFPRYYEDLTDRHYVIFIYSIYFITAKFS